ncbi:MAG: cupredoxin domain-containing protein [Actinobacteria bacterium]|nr:cupredoxin domain-containing protein [Actinomycetota bacterium]
MSRPIVVTRAAALRNPATRGRLIVAVACLVALTAACSSVPAPAVKVPEGRQFIPMVPDSIDDVGLAPSLAVDGEGLPNISYFGFAAQLEEGDIPVARPVGSPFLQTEDGGEGGGAVLLANLTTEQIWNRGAIAQPRESPGGVPVPFGPAAEPSLASLTPSSAKGTDIAIAGTDIHTTWTADTGVWYGLGPSFEIEAVEETREAGAPSIVTNGSGAPTVAYTVAGARPEVRVAERVGERWKVTPVTTLSACGEGCPPATHVALLGEELLVVVADPLSGELIAAQRQGDTWATEVVATDVTGGASLATAGDSATISFYTGSGLEVMTGGFGSWSRVTSLGSGTGAGASTEGASPSSGVAVDEAGTVWVSWEDGEGIHLASGADGEELEEVELPDTTGGVTPTVAITEDGSSVYLAWYDTVNADLRLGTYAEIPDLLIAAPSPPPQPAAPPAGGGDCGQDGEIVLAIVALNTAFDPTCLIGPAGEPFMVTFENQDAGIPHNFEILPEPGGEVLAATEVKPGIYTDELDVSALDEGNYYFQCVVHPEPMNGTLAVIAGGGGGGGNGGGG